MPTKQDIIAILDQIPDPEIGVSIYELGLIYDVRIDEKKGVVEILMTLTSIGCPLFDQIALPIKEKLGAMEGVEKVNVELTFEPPWTPDKMGDEAKDELGFL